MHQIVLPRIGTFEAWRDQARALAVADVAPEAVTWARGDVAPGLFNETPDLTAQREIRVPKTFVGLAGSVSSHSDPERFALLYTALIRLQSEPRLLTDRADPLIHRLRKLEKAVHRDRHKMKAFLRFREIESQGRRAFVAWFEPSHFIVESLADFFRNRFASMDFLIVTPDVSMRFDDGKTTFSLDTPRPPDIEDGAEDLWKTYFSNIFNPARLKISAMTSEMPKKYWKNLPEADLIPGLIADARAREDKMRQTAPTEPHVSTKKWRKPTETLEALAERARTCTRCPLHCGATQTVFGEGPSDAEIVIVGEQPGDQEDLAGRPFVGPAGEVFDAAARRAGLDRGRVYVTNAVKHFKYEQRGKRRIHQRPNAGEVTRCKWWLEQEIALIRPKLVVAMGATALQALTGSGKGLLSRRGTFEQSPIGPEIFTTVHPSYLLRIPDPATKATQTDLFESDLALVAARQNPSLFSQ